MSEDVQKLDKTAQYPRLFHPLLLGAEEDVVAAETSRLVYMRKGRVTRDCRSRKGRRARTRLSALVCLPFVQVMST